jgi:tryptophan synthase alpha chain
MTHIVLGYPSFEDSYKMVAAMVAADVDLMELQIPFSEPTADGPVIMHANQESLKRGATVQHCLEFAADMARTFDIPFLMMTYYNILFKHGRERFVATMARGGLRGAIIPDLPPEEGQDYFALMGAHDLAPILIFSPTTSRQRMNYLSGYARGFIYCVARKGVTGKETSFSHEMAAYLEQCRRATRLPLAVGFGVKGKPDVDFLKGKADIAVVGSETIRWAEREGIDAVGDFIRGLRETTVDE